MKHLLVITALLGLTAISTNTIAEEKIDFGRQVYPILRDHCLRCHGASYTDARSGRRKKPKGGIRLDTVALIKKGYVNDEDKAVPLVVAGKPQESPLYATTALPADHDDIMPASGDPLSSDQQAVLKDWISEGAAFSTFKAPVYLNPKAAK